MLIFLFLLAVACLVRKTADSCVCGRFSVGDRVRPDPRRPPQLIALTGRSTAEFVYRSPPEALPTPGTDPTRSGVRRGVSF